MSGRRGNSDEWAASGHQVLLQMLSPTEPGAPPLTIVLEIEILAFDPALGYLEVYTGDRSITSPLHPVVHCKPFLRSPLPNARQTAQSTQSRLASDPVTGAAAEWWCTPHSLLRRILDPPPLDTVAVYLAASSCLPPSERCHGVFSARYRGTSLIRNTPPVGPYSRPRPGALWWC